MPVCLPGHWWIAVVDARGGSRTRIRPGLSRAARPVGVPGRHRLVSSVSSGGRNRTCGLLVQSQASLPAATAPESLALLDTSSRHQVRGGGFEPPQPAPKAGGLPLADPRECPAGVEPACPAWEAGASAARPRAQIVRRKERESNPQGSSLARFRDGCRRQSACPSVGRLQGRDSNPHAFLHLINSQARLPVSPPWTLGSSYASRSQIPRRVGSAHHLRSPDGGRSPPYADSRGGRIRTGALLVPGQADSRFPTPRIPKCPAGVEPARPPWQGGRLPLHHGHEMPRPNCQRLREHRVGLEPTSPHYGCGVLAAGRPVQNPSGTGGARTLTSRLRAGRAAASTSDPCPPESAREESNLRLAVIGRVFSR